MPKGKSVEIKNSFKQSFYKLLNIYDFDDISIDMLTESSNKSRRAFYKYYANTTELFEDLVFDFYKDLCSQKTKGKSLLRCYLELIKTHCSYRILFLRAADDLTIFFNIFHKNVTKIIIKFLFASLKPSSFIDDNVVYNFYSFGLFASTVEWVKKGCDVSVSKMYFSITSTFKEN